MQHISNGSKHVATTLLAAAALALAGCSSEAADDEASSSSSEGLTATRRTIAAKAEGRKLGLLHYDGTRSGGTARFTVVDTARTARHEVLVNELSGEWTARTIGKDAPLTIAFHDFTFHYRVGDRSFAYDGATDIASADRDALAARQSDVREIFVALDELGLLDEVLGDAASAKVAPRVRGGGGWVQGRGAAGTKSWASYQAASNANGLCSNQFCWGCYRTLQPDCLCALGMFGGDYGCACRVWGERCGGY